MATQWSDLDGQKSGATIQMEGHTLMPSNGQIGPKEMEASSSTPLHSPSQSPVRKQMPDHPETWYCLEIQVTSTEDGGTTPPPPHTWQAPVVEDMICNANLASQKWLWQVQTGPSYSMKDNP